MKELDEEIDFEVEYDEFAEEDQREKSLVTSTQKSSLASSNVTREIKLVSLRNPVGSAPSTIKKSDNSNSERASLSSGRSQNIRMVVTVNKMSLTNPTKTDIVNSERQSIQSSHHQIPSPSSYSNNCNLFRKNLPSRTISNDSYHSPRSNGVATSFSRLVSASSTPLSVARMGYSTVPSQSRPLYSIRPPVPRLNYSQQVSHTRATVPPYTRPIVSNMNVSLPIDSRFGRNATTIPLNTPTRVANLAPFYTGPVGKRKCSNNQNSQSPSAPHKKVLLDGTFKPQTDVSPDKDKVLKKVSTNGNGTPLDENVSIETPVQISNPDTIPESTKGETLKKSEDRNNSKHLPPSVEVSQQSITTHKEAITHPKEVKNIEKTKVKISQLLPGEGVNSVKILLNNSEGGQIYSYSKSERVVLVQFNNSDQATDFITKFSGQPIRGLPITIQYVD